MPEKEKQVAVPAKNPGAKEDPEIFGSWMIAQRKSRKNIPHQRRTGDNSAREQNHDDDVQGDMPLENQIKRAEILPKKIRTLGESSPQPRTHTKIGPQLKSVFEVPVMMGPNETQVQVGLNGASHVGAQSHEATVQTRTSGRQLRERAHAAGATKEDIREVVGPQSHNVQNVAQTHVNQLRASGSSPQDMNICNARPPDKDQTMMSGDNSVDHMKVCEDTIMVSAEPLLAVRANKPNQNGF
ncbi:single-stranded-DNA-specific exonuclease RecJ [Sesbania bispinosa]|nr:single-stranded-DNA-specific exonuclease RecJ [Sesbania bispinosa]